MKDPTFYELADKNQERASFIRIDVEKSLNEFEKWWRMAPAYQFYRECVLLEETCDQFNVPALLAKHLKEDENAIGKAIASAVAQKDREEKRKVPVP